MPDHPGRSARPECDAPNECRIRLAGLLHVDTSERIVLTHNATHALNLAILGLGLKSGQEVVTSVTEHNSVLRPLSRLKERQGVRVTVIGLNREGALDDASFEEALERSPRLIALNHASNVTGCIQPVTSWFARARRAGAVTLLDASQSLGHLSIDARALCADMIAFTGHKALRGPAGTGGLYIGPGIELEQVLVGGTGVRSDLRLHPPELPTRLEAGTQNIPALAGLNAALSWHETHGEAFEAAGMVRMAQILEGLRKIPRVTLFGERGDAEGIGMVSFRIEGWDVEETGFVLAESFGIMGRTGLHCAPLIHEALGSAPSGTVRLSPSGATTEEEIAYTLQAVRRMAA